MAVVAAAVLAACGGDDGDPGAPGAPGPRSEAPESLNATITDVRNGSRPLVEFEVEDENGFPFRRLEADAVSFTVVKLVPGSDGDTNRWQTYILEDDGNETDAQAGTYAEGSFTNNDDGTYTFRFADQLQNISGIGFNGDLTHRVGMEIRDATFSGEEIPGTDATFTFRPSDGATEGIATRKLVAQESCAECHGTEEFAFHGGPRQSVDYCVTCHQPGSVDAQTGNTMDFRVMIHKIHMGEELPSVEAGGDYAFCGFACDNFGAPPTSFADVAHPQDQRNCLKCHDPEDDATPDAINYAQSPSIEACGACHDDVDFSTGSGHPTQEDDNTACQGCHSEGGSAGSVPSSHVIPTQRAAQRFEYNVLGVTNTGEGQSPQITFSITDPTNNDSPYDIANDPPFTGAETSVNMDIAWPTSDYSNVANDAGTAVTGDPPANPVSIALADGSGSLPTGVSDNGDGTFTVDTSQLSTPLTIPATNPPLGSGAVAIEGHPAADFDDDGTFDDQVPVTGAVEFFAINDSEPQPRRQVVSSDKCADCHAENDGLAFHGNNRTDNTQLCVVCHNPNNTDLAQRAEDPDGVEDGDNTASNNDFNLEERAIDFRRMIHAIHGAQKRTTDYWVYGFFNTPHDFSDVGFPRGSNECQACHVDDSQRPPLADGVLATTVDTQATVNTANQFGTDDFVDSNGDPTSGDDPTNDGNITATASACSGCHDSDDARSHMLDNGAGIDREAPGTVTSGMVVTQGDIDSGSFRESCAVCHGADRIADVNEAHGLAEQ